MNPGTGNLKVDNVCPFVPTRFTQSGCNHFCKSCNKTIIDFRGKTDEEIKAVITKDTCGIFTSDQLPGQQKMQFKKKPLFYLMSFLSLLGFSVTPVNAQTQSTDSLKMSTQQQKPALTREQQELMQKVMVNPGLIAIPPKKEEKDKKAPSRFRTVGCPSF